MTATRLRGRNVSTRRGQHERSGTAAVEFALCLPLLIAMVFGVVETSNAVYLQNALTSAAYEASSVVSIAGGTSTNATTRANAVLTALGANGATVTISPTVTSATTLGTEITVTVSAPLSSNSLMFGFLGNRTLTARLVSQRL
jgi:Flp pilus assembly protein TadG